MISEQLEIIIQKAFELAKNKKHEFLTLEHLLLELCDADDVKKFFSYKMVNIQSIKNDLNGYMIIFNSIKYDFRKIKLSSNPLCKNKC